MTDKWLMQIVQNPVFTRPVCILMENSFLKGRVCHLWAPPSNIWGLGSSFAFMWHLSLLDRWLGTSAALPWRGSLCHLWGAAVLCCAAGSMGCSGWGDNPVGLSGLWKQAPWWGLCPVLIAVAKEARSICSCCSFQVFWEFRAISPGNLITLHHLEIEIQSMFIEDPCVLWEGEGMVVSLDWCIPC